VPITAKRLNSLPINCVIDYMLIFAAVQLSRVMWRARVNIQLEVGLLTLSPVLGGDS